MSVSLTMGFILFRVSSKAQGIDTHNLPPEKLFITSGNVCLFLHIYLCFRKKSKVGNYAFRVSMKVYVRRNNNKVDSKDSGWIVITHLLSWRDQGNCRYFMLFWITDDILSYIMIYYHHCLPHKYNFICSPIWTTYWLISDRKIMWFLSEISMTLSMIFI